MASSSAETFVGAPGKVLIVGGYLVLERPNIGLVVTVSARVYARVRTEVAPDQAEDGWSTVTVESPQLHQTRHYRYRNDDALRVIERTCDTSANPFVEHSITSALRIAQHFSCLPASTHLRITILGDNEFYSQRDTLQSLQLPLTHASLAALPRFQTSAPSSSPSGSQHSAALAKTGLGSSAALTVALVGGLLHHLGVVQLPSTESPTTQEAVKSQALTLVHTVAQISHCAAQGKIGSGFDVAAATFGSCTYARFSPSYADPAQLTSSETAAAMLSNAGIAPSSSTPLSLVMSAEGGWDSELDHFELPPGLLLVLGDVCCGGSSTTSMVSAILKWRQEQPEQATPVWTELQEANVAIAQALRDLNQVISSDPDLHGAIEACSSVNFSSDDTTTHPAVVASLRALARTFARARRGLRQLGEGAHVPVEPPEQTQLCDATIALPGVVACAVPGAGGYDAVYALVCGEQAAAQVRAAWEKWSSMSVVPLSLHADGSGILSISKWVQ